MTKNLIAENVKALSRIYPIEKIKIFKYNLIIIVKPSVLLELLHFLKHHTSYQFEILTCISGVDYPSQKYRFKVVYELLSVKYNTRLRVKVLTDELTPVESCCKIFPAAGWYESETWDMYGIFFANHTNLTRLLTDYGFEGYPLRKDFPLSGFVESSYDYTRKRVTNERVELSQEYRAFKFTSPWETLELN